MSEIPSGIQKSVFIGKETTWGVAALTNAGKTMRRVTADLNLMINTFQSAEKRTDYQTVDMRNGTRRVEGSLNGELSCATYQDLWAALLRGSWTTGVTVTAATIAASDAGVFIRSAGSWITMGVKVGDLVLVSGFTDPANNGQHLVTGVTATDLSVATTTLVDEVEGDSVTVAVDGKKVMVPSSGHTKDSFTIECLYDMNGSVVSELSVGNRVTRASIQVTPNGIATVAFTFIGKDMDSDTSAYFVAPAAPTVTGVAAGPQGMILKDGVPIATVTGFSFDVDGAGSPGEVVGSQTTPDVFLGRVTCTGQLTAYFTDSTLWTAYKEEDELSLVLRLNAGTDQAFVAKLPRIKLGGNTKDDPDTGGIVQTVPFTGLKYIGTGPYEATTICIQDTEAV